MSKETLGYPTRTAAVLALMEQGLDNRSIRQKIGISTGTVSAIILSTLRAKSRPAPSSAPRRERLNIRRETADKIIAYMRIGQSDLAFGDDAAARSSRLLVAALKRHNPERCGQ